MKNEKKGSGISLGRIWSQYSFIFVLVIIMIGYAFTIQANGNTFNFGHIAAILSSQNTVIVGTIALGMAFVIITGQIDLSVGSSLVLCTGATIVVFNVTNSIPLMILTAQSWQAASLAFLIAMLLLDPAISGSSSSQFAMLSSNSNYMFLRKTFGAGKLTFGGFSLPYIFFVFLFMAILFIVISRNTKYGKSIYAVGSNEKSARLAGINVTWVKISVFILTGLCVGVASLLQACKISNVTPASSGVSYEMYAIASVVLAGINMAGGKGKLLGVIFGALSYTTINFIIVSIPGLSVDIQDTFQGLVLIIVILIQTVGPVIRENLQRAKKRRQAAAAEKA